MNSLLHSITAAQLGRLQKVQNTVVRLILRRNRHCIKKRVNNNNNNNICLKSNIQTSSVDYAPRELTHACSRGETCSRSDTEACDMRYVF